jgi:hypothetical protein
MNAIRECPYMRKLSQSCSLLAEVLATELLDFIHVVIDVGGDSNEADLAEKKMSDYFSEFLFEKDVHNMDHILPHIDPEIK